MKKTPRYVSRLKKKKEDALDEVIDAYLPLVKAIVRNILASGREADREECINDVFLLVWQNVHQFHGDETDFKKWIGMVAKYRAIDRYRQLQQAKNGPTAEEQELKDITAWNTEQTVEQKEQRHALLAAIALLPEIDRDIFMLKYFLEFSNQEVANQLGLTKAAVDNRLYRGKKVLASSRQLKELLI